MFRFLDGKGCKILHCHKTKQNQETAYQKRVIQQDEMLSVESEFSSDVTPGKNSQLPSELPTSFSLWCPQPICISPTYCWSLVLHFWGCREPGPAGFCAFTSAGSSTWNTFPVCCSLPLTRAPSVLTGSLNPTSPAYLCAPQTQHYTLAVPHFPCG